MRFWTIMLLLLLSGCSTPGVEQRKGYQVDTRHQAYGARPRIKVLVIHYTAEDFPSSLATLTDRNVSSHYLINDGMNTDKQQPMIWQLVPESQLAWHAGPSFWRGATRINDTSVGIELVNPGYRRTLTGVVWTPFTPRQIAVLQPLLRDITQRYQIRPENIVGHSDIAPQRKQDPGPLFPWRLLAQQGIGAWPDAQRVNYWLNQHDAQQQVTVEEMVALLARYGYQVNSEMSAAQQRKVIAAFQMHFRPADYRGLPDAESWAIARALVEKYAVSD